MKSLCLLVALAHVAFAGVNIQMPFVNPAGVTYISNAAPALRAAPLAAAQYGAPAYAQYAAPAFAQYGAPAYAARLAAPAYAARLAAPAYAQYGAPAYAARFAAPVTAVPALRAQYAAVTAAPVAVHGVAKVPYVNHVPAVADVPVTSIQAHHGVVQNLVDVAKPHIASRTIQVRRPAISKQFYDVEERVIVRPAGSAVVELEEPISKEQRGPTLIRQGVAVQQAAYPVAHAAVPAAYTVAKYHSPAYAPLRPAVSVVPTGQAPLPQQDFSQESQGNDDAVVIDARARARAGQSQQNQFEQRSGPLPTQGPLPDELRELPQARNLPIARSQQLIPSARNIQFDPSINQANQQNLIQLLTRGDGVSEIGFGASSRSGPLPRGQDLQSEGPGPQVRGRVISAEQRQGVPDERVSVRRIVVSRPIETFEDIEVNEPFTKIERVAVNQPAVFKTAHHGIARVPTSVPVVGKAAVPTLQYAYPTGVPAYAAYH